MIVNTMGEIKQGRRVTNSSDWFQIKIGWPSGLHWEGDSWAKVYLGWVVLEIRGVISCKPYPAQFNYKISLLSTLHLHCSALRSWPQAQGMSETPRMYVCQSPASDPACLTTDGSCGKFASIHDTTVSWEGKQELFLFSPSLIPQSVVKSLAPVQ